MKTFYFILLAFLIVKSYGQMPSIQSSKGLDSAIEIADPFQQEPEAQTSVLSYEETFSKLKIVYPEALRDIDNFNEFKRKMIFLSQNQSTDSLTHDLAFFEKLHPMFNYQEEAIIGYNKTYIDSNQDLKELEIFKNDSDDDGKDSKITVSTYHLPFYRNKIKSITSQIEILEKRILDANSGLELDEINEIVNEIEEKKDSVKKYQLIVDKINNSRPRPKLFFPSMQKGGKNITFNTLYTEIGSQNFYFVKNATFQFNDSGGVAESELVSSYLGPTRVTLGSIVANSNENTDNIGDEDLESTDTEAFQRLIAGGGNLYLNFELPLFLFQKNSLLIYFNGSARFNLDVAEFSSDIDTSTGNGNLKTNVYISLSTDNEIISFFGNASFGHYFGHKSFIEQLNIGDRENFSFGQITTGLTISNKLRIALTLNTFGNVDALNSGKVIIGAQILSGLFEK